MTPAQTRKIYDKARAAYGTDPQVIAACEEFAELIVELTKLNNKKRDLFKNNDRKKIVDELADASIMLEQTIYNLSLLSPGIIIEIKERKEEKLNRLNRRLS